MNRHSALLARHVAPFLVATALSANVTAQPATSDAPFIEEVVVTAQKRSEPLQDVPISITAFSQSAMEELQIVNTKDIQIYTPGLAIAGLFNDSGPEIYLRGIGNATFRSVGASPVGVYNDQIYLGNHIAHGFQLFDIERIEVLKGPQGTLYGRNTTGGLINYSSRKPKIGQDPDGYLAVTAGDFGEFIVDGAGGFSVGDSLGFRFAYQSRQRDGLFNNENPDSGTSDDGDVDWSSWRAQVRFQPSDEWDLLFKLQGASSNSEVRPRKNVGMSGDGCDPAIVGNPNCSDSRGIVASEDWHGTATSFKTQDEPEFLLSSLTIERTIGNLTITSLTGYMDASRESSRDSDWGPGEVSNSVYHDEDREFSQEIRIANSGAEKLNWLAGLYYYTAELDSLLGLPQPSQPGFWNFLTDINTGNFPPSFGPTPEGLAIEHHQETESWAVFVDGNYHLTETLRVTAGFRWTNDEREVGADTFIYDASDIITQFHNLDDARDRFLRWASEPDDYAGDWSDWGGRLVLDYSPAEDLLLWGGISRGFKGGEFNTALWPASDGTPPGELTEPEYLTNIEGGIKSTLLDGGLVFNLSAFRYDFEDMQVFLFGPIDPNNPDSPLGTRLLNAAESTVEGLEVDVAYAPTVRWYFKVLLGLYDGKYDTFRSDLTAPPGDPLTDFSGNDLPQLPELTASAIVRYEMPLGRHGHLSFQADYGYQDGAFYSQKNSELESRDSYSLIGARIGYLSPDERLSIAVWGKNLEDENYHISGSFNRGLNAMQYSVGDPMTWGLTARYRFGAN